MDMEIIRFTRPGKVTEKSPLLETVNQPIPATHPATLSQTQQ